MKIERHTPIPQTEIRMTFSFSEAWAVRAALYDWVKQDPTANEHEKWKGWLTDLEKILNSHAA